MDKTEKEEGEEVLEGHQAGVRLSELELLASKNHAFMSSIGVLYNDVVYMFIIVWCRSCHLIHQ